MLDKSKPVTFTFNGRTITAYEGDTIASALYRAGVRVLSRGFKYHRPRGLMCVAGHCPNCLVDVDATPNVRSCMAPVAGGMAVKSQNTWPSLERDVMHIFDRFSSLLPVGFYYKTFMFPRRFWPHYERVLRNAAGLGAIDPDPDRFEDGRGHHLAYDKQYRHADVSVIGGGPAGLMAALTAAGQGARVVLVDENRSLGGHLRFSPGPLPPTVAELPALAGLPAAGQNTGELVSALAAAVHNHPAITILTEATAFGWYEGNMIGVVQERRLIKLRTAQLVVATGRIEQPLVFHNNDLPGIFLATGLQRLIHLYGIKPGERALVLATHDAGWQAAADLLEAGVELALVADARPSLPDLPPVARLKAAGVPLKSGFTIEAAHGRGRVSGARLVQLDGEGQPLPGTAVDVTCDLIAIAGGFVPNNGLLYQSGCQIRHDERVNDFVPLTFASGIMGAGHAVATEGLEAILLEGALAGLAAALQQSTGNGQQSTINGQQSTVDSKPGTDHSNYPVREGAQEKLALWRARLDELKEEWGRGSRLASERAAMPVTIPSRRKKKFVCYCEDVTEKDVQDAIAEGFDNVETLKRYTTVSMGPCQGKMCSLNAIRLCAREMEQPIAETGTTTSRPPFVPVKLGVLAGRKMEPVRYTPMHRQHDEKGAHWLDAGQWKRPDHYGNATAEVRAVRENAGLIDVSTLGKLDVRGPDAVALLERLYTNRFAGLPVGQIRYGVMCTDEGILFDDGVVCRLADDHFYLTTTTGGVTAVYEWMAWWAAAWKMRVHISNVTAAYAAVNLAGPKARQVLAGVCDLDLATEAFPYMHFREAVVAGVPARLLRIGFVGEMGYEIHYPAGYGAHVWDALLVAGRHAGLVPFGLEAQRVLRLEKRHIIAGQDTDALSDPMGADMAWIVKQDKEEFIGKPSLAFRNGRGLQEQLVGFVMADHTLVPLEGEQIVAGDQLIGRVTSARYSPTLDQAIGMAWVIAAKAHEGAAITVLTRGQPAEARVTCEPFYDPKGERLRT
jgi:sarcosine oxidase, subunit alpha